MDNIVFGKTLHYYDDKDEQIFLSKSKQIVDNVSMWHYNRPLDENHINEIADYIEDSGSIDGMIYIAELVKDDNIRQHVCYDGNHRLKALKILSNDYDIIVNVMWNATEKDIISKYQSLNKSNPISELYYDPINENMTKIKDTIQSTVLYFVNAYPKMLSTSNNPRKPNFNRDKLSDKLLNVIRNQNRFDIEASFLLNKLIELNDHYMENKHLFIDINEKVIKKCEKYDCYLFMRDIEDNLIL